MNRTEKEQIIEAMNSYMAHHSLSQNKFAKLSEVNISYISSMIQGRFDNHAVGEQEIVIADKWFHKIAEYIGYKINKEYWPIMATVQLAQMMLALDESRTSGRVKLMIGESGSGKTIAADLFCKSHPNDAFKVTVSSLHSVGDIIDDIMDALRIEIKGTKSRKIKTIAAHVITMRREGLHPVIIIDEGENMKMPALTMIKALYDALSPYCPIILIGTDQLLLKLEKMKLRNKDGMPQFFRRFRAGIRQIPAIDRSFSAFIGSLDKGLQNLIRELCDNYGELHDYLEPAIRESDISGERLSEAFVRKMYGLSK